MSTLENAIQLAAQSHAGQVDKAGQPYILHPIRVMLSVQGESARITAVLHDVVEDSKVTIGDLAAAGFKDEVVEAIRVLTKLPGELRIQAAARASSNPIARAVKLADVSDNMNLSRITQPTVKDYERMAEYARVRDLLESESHHVYQTLQGHKPTYNITEMMLEGKDLHVPNANLTLRTLMDFAAARHTEGSRYYNVIYNGVHLARFAIPTKKLGRKCTTHSS